MRQTCGHQGTAVRLLPCQPRMWKVYLSPVGDLPGCCSPPPMCNNCVASAKVPAPSAAAFAGAPPHVRADTDLHLEWVAVCEVPIAMERAVARWPPTYLPTYL